ncbi:MAG: protein-L-isoaspartate(D-aspartate) O-methyltransferase [Burkholderiaceae bacterium]
MARSDDLTRRPAEYGPKGWTPPSARPIRAATVATPVPATGLGLASARGRGAMVDQLARLGVRDGATLAAMASVPRHAFVDQGLASRAYDDVSLPIGLGQTISRPSTVARMVELALEPLDAGARASAKVLEVGTGCGYQAAVLAHIVGDVVSIERLRGLHEAARANLRSLRLGNLRLVYGDGRLGVPQMAPYDAIIVAAAGDEVPQALLEQLRPGARLVAPVIEGSRQTLHLVERRDAQSWQLRVLDAVRFVPLKAGTE